MGVSLPQTPVYVAVQACGYCTYEARTEYASQWCDRHEGPAAVKADKNSEKEMTSRSLSNETRTGMQRRTQEGNHEVSGHSSVVELGRMQVIKGYITQTPK